jgi:aspartate aminotransferase-like enzyme
VGFEQVRARCELLAEVTRDAAGTLGLQVFSKSPSPSVTALITPSDSGKIRDRLESEYNITIMGGQDQQKGKILRIGHMGDVRDGDMLALFEALAEILGKTAAWPDLKKQMTAKLQATPALFNT